MNDKRHKASESFRAWAPDFDEWPVSWMGIEEDLAYGRKLLPYFTDFLQALHAEGISRKTFTQYRDNLWLLGGTLIREVSLLDEYQDDPQDRLIKFVTGNAVHPEHYGQMNQAELRDFERLCRKFAKYLQCS